MSIRYRMEPLLEAKTYDLNQMVKLPRFEFIAEYLVMVTRTKASRDLVQGYQVKKKGSTYQVVSTSVGTGTIDYETNDPSKLFDYVRRGALGYFTKEADGLRISASKRMEAILESLKPEYAPATDRSGQALKPGDKVSFKTYPKGTAQGEVIVSPKTKVQHEGAWLPALVIKSGDTTYPLISKGVRKLREDLNLSETGGKEWVVYLADKKDPMRWDSRGVMSLSKTQTLYILAADKAVPEDENRKIVWRGFAKDSIDGMRIARHSMQK